MCPHCRSGANGDLQQIYAVKTIVGIYSKNCRSGTHHLTCGEYCMKSQPVRHRRQCILHVWVSWCDHNCFNTKQSMLCVLGSGKKPLYTPAFHTWRWLSGFVHSKREKLEGKDASKQILNVCPLTSCSKIGPVW